MLSPRCLLLATLAASAAGLHAAAGAAGLRGASVRPPLSQLSAAAVVAGGRRSRAVVAQAEEEEYMTEEEYLAETQQEETKEMSAEAQKIMRGMTSESGVEFAPWLKIDAEAIAKANAEREARKAKAAASAMKRSDAMLVDPQAAEVGAGGGLKSKILSEEEVELRWDTSDEQGNVGFIVERRAGGQSNFEQLASYERFSPLRSKGPAGGTYVYLDDGAGVGTWVYRIVDCDAKGQRSAVCQKLVEIDSVDEQRGTILIGSAIAGLAFILIIAGIISDPIQTTSSGASLF